MKGITLDDFRSKHDPTYVILAPTAVYERAIPEGTKRFIITSAQNATPVCSEFWAVLRTMADKLEAEPLVIPLRYKNPTSQWTGSQQNTEYWDERIRPFLWNVRKDLNENLAVLGDIKIQPTASSPLTGAEAISHASSGIIGHPKIHTRAIPTPQNKMAKLLMTSGSVTVANYTDSRAGRIGEYHHSLSAVLVELDGKRFYARRLNFDKKSNSVIDLDRRYFAGKVERAPPALALAMGDTHVKFIDPAVEKATFGEGGLVDICRPNHLIFHDLLDAYSCNPHHVGNPFIAYAKRMANADNVKQEVDEAIEFVRQRTTKVRKSIIVGSNHDDMLTRWVMSNDWRKDPVNASFYLETALAMVGATELGKTGTEYPAAFPYWFERAKIPNARCLRSDESFVIGRDEFGFHFDRGPNGARGSIKNMRRLGVRTIGGHAHSPGEDEDALQLGTSTRLTAEYVRGPSSWLNAHATLNADENRQLIVIVDGEYRLSA